MAGDVVVVRVELVRTEAGPADAAGWTAYLSTEGLGGLDSVMQLEGHPRLASVVVEIRRIVAGLREWIGPLRVEITLSGSASAARVAARAHGVALPR